jgi:hypothetical protein
MITPDAMLGVLDMFEWFKKKAKTPQSVVEKVAKVKVAEPPAKTEKQIATEKGEPYVAVLSMDVDPNNLHQGAFELDWNEIFVARLIKAGYMMKPTDSDCEIVDRWFQNICRHVVMETWEQEQAIKNSGMYVQKRDLGDGRSEIG